MSKKGVAIYWLIFWSVVIGIVIGIIAVQIDAVPFVKYWISPLGSIFIKILNLIAIPLLVVSLIRGIINLESTTKLVSMGWRTLVVYMSTTIIATLFAIAIVFIVKPGEMVSSHSTQIHFGELSTQADSTIQSAGDLINRSPLETIVDIVPDNIITPLSGSSNMLQALVLAILIGVAIVTVKNERLQSLRDLIADFESMLNHAIDMAMYIAPVGIMALMANVIVDSGGDIDLLKALGLYTLTTIAAIIAFAVLFYPAMIMLFTKIKVRQYLSAIIPVQLMAISTSSSAATLPTTMKVANDDLGIPKSVTSFTLPMGVTINMDGSSIFISITVIFIAQMLNIDLTAAQVMTIIFTSIIASVGTPGIPGGVLVTIVLVLEAINIPVESIALIIALIRPIDMFVTALNVTGDVAVSAVVAANIDSDQDEE